MASIWEKNQGVFHGIDLSKNTSGRSYGNAKSNRMEENQKKRKEIQSKIDNLTKNMEISRFKSEIQTRIDLLKKELE